MSALFAISLSNSESLNGSFRIWNCDSRSGNGIDDGNINAGSDGDDLSSSKLGVGGTEGSECVRTGAGGGGGEDSIGSCLICCW